jgi:hypothetical protein
LAVDAPGAPPGHKGIVLCSGLGGHPEVVGVCAVPGKANEVVASKRSSDFSILDLSRRVYRTRDYARSLFDCHGQNTAKGRHPF